MAVRCGRCSRYHESVAACRDCFNGLDADVVDIPTQSRKNGPTDKQWNFLNALIERTGKPKLTDDERENYTRLSISAYINEAKIEASHAPKDYHGSSS
jgi:hypothetical protein